MGGYVLSPWRSHPGLMGSSECSIDRLATGVFAPAIPPFDQFFFHTPQRYGLPMTSTRMSRVTTPSSPSTAQEASTTTPPYPIPYVAASDRLPEPLPTDATIRCSSKVLKAGYGRRIVRVGEHFVVKYGVLVSLTEGENMLFVRETCDISVPQVFALYSRIDPSGAKVSYIVMEYIRGKSLDSRWDTMSAADKSNTSQQLRLMFDKLRSIPSPGYFGCIGRRPMEECMFWTLEEDSVDAISGPFDSETQLNNALVEKYLYNSGMPSKAKFYRRVLPLVLYDHASVFSHGDFQRKNVLVGDDGNLSLVDWESAGWYPSYWEYALAMFACGGWRDDWHEYVASILDEYPNEYVWFDMMRRELWS
ncbi:hypothetical protein J3458_016858 [Metarhizium acridum]|nr:hypothetical protein J3458_016858 [Metarhizium acridum]